MRVCVIGGTGNISTSIVRLLVAVGHEVTVFNRGLSPGLPPGVRQLVGDRKDRAGFEAAMQAGAFEAAIDMICFDADDAASALRACSGVRHFVFCSTVCTYGVDYDWLPATEDHPLRPISPYGRNKVAAERTFLAAHYAQGFPVTIIRPSTTFGPRWPLLRQVDCNANPSWVTRVREGRPLVVCGDGRALHQWLHVDDAAPAFVFPLGRERCLGQAYNMVKAEFGTWEQYHRTAMQVIGREVELVGVPLANLLAAGVPHLGTCESIFSYNTIYSPAKLRRDVPEFDPKISLEEGLRRVLEAMEQSGCLDRPCDSDWEDRLIAAQKHVGAAAGS